VNDFSPETPTMLQYYNAEKSPFDKGDLGG